MRDLRLRTKFLLSLLAVIAGLSITTLLVVRYTVENRIRESLRDDLHHSVNAFTTFDRQRQLSLSQTAAFIADLPNVRALMTTQDPATIQDASAGLQRLSDSDIFLLADRTARVQALRSRSSSLTQDMAQQLLVRSLSRGEPRDWWSSGDHLYEIWIQPVNIGRPPNETSMGILAIGYEIDDQAARGFANISGSEIAFRSSGSIVASTLEPSRRSALRIASSALPVALGPVELQLGNERYLASSVSLLNGSTSPVSLIVLKSLDQATGFLGRLNRTLLYIGLACLLTGALLGFFISDTVARPLASLVSGVRALEGGDYGYALDTKGRGEVGLVTSAFVHMRESLARVQEDQKQLEERLRQAHKMEAVGRLAGGVAHDFNNLLTVIRGHADLLTDRASADASLKRSAEQIQKAAGRAVSMTRQLLAFSRMQILQPRVVDLNVILVDLGKMLPRLIGENIEYAFVPSTQLASIKADPGQIEQVIMNLAVNARDAMPDGGKLIIQTSNTFISEAEASRRPAMTAGDYVLLTVTDTGIGMDAKTKAHIFEPFFTTKEVGKGTGLGLATVYGIVKQSGGFIFVESEPGKGAAFQIYFPQTGAQSASADTGPAAAKITRGSETVLVVEDEEAVRELAAEFLKSAGYTVLQASDGFQALEIAQRYQEEIHLLLSDMIMPRMSGAELVAQLSAFRPNARHLLMSGYMEYAAAQSPVGSAGVPTLQKPFSMASLVNKVREVLSGVPHAAEVAADEV